LKINHRNSNKNKSGTLSQDDIQELNVWTAGWRGDRSDLDFYLKKAASTYTITPQKYRLSTTRVAGGVCLDCEKQRCPKCNGCPIDVFEKVLETTHCQRCICYDEKEQEHLNYTGISLDELVRRRQGNGFKNKRGLK
jgi:hypothetical protein